MSCMSQHPGARKYWVVHPKNISGSKFVMGFSFRPPFQNQRPETGNQQQMEPLKQCNGVVQPTSRIHGGPGKPGGQKSIQRRRRIHGTDMNQGGKLWELYVFFFFHSITIVCWCGLKPMMWTSMVTHALRLDWRSSPKNVVATWSRNGSS